LSSAFWGLPSVPISTNWKAFGGILPSDDLDGELELRESIRVAIGLGSVSSFGAFVSIGRKGASKIAGGVWSVAAMGGGGILRCFPQM
jgi:hypothetical protein